MKNRTKLAFSAVVMIATVPLAASSCQELVGIGGSSPFHFDITTMGIASRAAVESPANTFRLPAGPAKRTLQITLQSRAREADGVTRPRQPEFCTLDLGGRMPISFVQVEGDTYTGQVPTPTRFDVGKAATGNLLCEVGGMPLADAFNVVIVK